jgi:hypothetical protein
MIPKAIDSLDFVEALMVIEEVFEIDDTPDDTARAFLSPREIVNWLEPQVANKRPNRQTAAMLRKLAKGLNHPELAAGLEGPWRREQIAAIIREIFSE